ncbi:MAG TPA: GNAT family N-acetyltransferase, partial [Planctomycetota bacterium]|nr:GNAT family N-acetyltransferase [Planctomycetota bacterium]
GVPRYAMKSAWSEHYRARTVTAEAAVAAVRRGTRVFVASGCAEPVALVTALGARRDVADVEVLHIMTVGDAPYARASAAGSFRHNAFFIGANVREAVAAGAADYTPIFLSEVPALFRSGRVRPEVALITTTPPDKHGFCSIGVSVDVVRAAIETARVIVAEVNPHMPRTHGASFVHVEDIDFFVANDSPLLEIPRAAPDEVTSRIGRFCAGLVPDGATLQLGIGGIPDAALAAMRHKRDLGIHSEMISDGVIDLIEAGAITCARKTYHPRRAVVSFCMGTRRLYDAIDDNPFFEFLPTEVVNDPVQIAKNDRMISINSALEVDLTGQVCADSIGTRFYSGIGGQVDFIRGAARSAGGRSIIAIPSTAKDGARSRIVPMLAEGAGVVTTRGDVHTIVTEHGVAELKGRTVRERALALISIAHPDFRGDLMAAAKDRKLVPVDQAPWPKQGKPYPVELETTERFAGLEVAFRPIRPTDERALRDFFYSHSAETIFNRYHMALRSLPPQRVAELCTVDYDARMALAGFVRDGEAERMVAVGRYEVDRSSGLAEVAFTVHDDLQGKGIGTWLLHRLVDVARDRGVQGFVGYVLPGNVRMLQLFHRWGGPVRSRLEEGVYTITLRFADAGKQA